MSLDTANLLARIVALRVYGYFPKEGEEKQIVCD